MSDEPDDEHRPLAAIDVGTNSVHLVIARPGPGGSPDVLVREKAPVRLGSGGHDMKHLETAAVDRTVDALARFRRLALAQDAEVVAIATSAVREAEDRDVFLRRARDEAGIDVEVVSGVEEARLIHLGALAGVPIAERRHLVVDVGGGSTELVVGHGTTPLLLRSLKLGHIRLTDRFFPGGVIEDDAVRACRDHVAAFLAPVARDIAQLGFEVAVGCSGTIETLAAMAAARRGEEIRTVDNLVLTRTELGEVVQDLVARPRPEDRVDLPGLDAHRRDVVVAGAVLVRTLMKSLGVEQLTVSPFALREGVLVDRFARRGVRGGSLHLLGDLRRASVLATARRFDEDLDHAEHATDLALELFDETVGIHGYGPAERDVLEAAGLLHNIGRYVAHAAHHKHSYYLVRNSEHLAGFSDHEIELIAQVARYHRKSSPRPKHAEYAALDPADQERVRVLAGLLRVAIGLDRTYRRVVQRVTARVGSGGTEPAPRHATGAGEAEPAPRHATAPGAAEATEPAGRDALVVEVVVAPGADADLELFVARERSGLLVEALGRPVVLRVVEDDERGAAAHPSSRSPESRPADGHRVEVR